MTPVTDAANMTEPRPVPASQGILIRALTVAAIVGLVQLVVLGVLGFFLAGLPGLVGALLGSALSVFFLGLTALSIVIANRFIATDFYVVLFFVIVLGTWLLKFIAFIVAALLLRDQPWLNATVLFLSIIVGVIVSLVVDVVVVAKSRLPYVSDIKI
jgi:hypothetical protein